MADVRTPPTAADADHVLNSGQVTQRVLGGGIDHRLWPLGEIHRDEDHDHEGEDAYPDQGETAPAWALRSRAKLDRPTVDSIGDRCAKAGGVFFCDARRHGVEGGQTIE